MYSPVKDGIDKSAHAVRYSEAKPPSDLAGLVHSFWELKATGLAEDFELHVLPDACVNILFNLCDTRIAAITALQTTHEVLNLGKTFHYAGVQLLPGVWRGDGERIFDGFVGEPYEGELPLAETAAKLAGLDFEAQQAVSAELVRQLVDGQVIAPNDTTAIILANLDNIHTVVDMAALTGMSPRQLQRTLKQATGFAPHDFLKVLRLQRSFKRDYHGVYADQSHFIHSFRKITGYTPVTYAKRFDV